MLKCVYTKRSNNTTAKKRINISLSDNVFNDLEKLSKEKGLTKSGLLTVLITNEVERKGNNEQKK